MIPQWNNGRSKFLKFNRDDSSVEYGQLKLIKFYFSQDRDQHSPAESSSTTGIQALAKESLMRSTLLQMASLSPSPRQQFPNGICKPIPDTARRIPLHASANFWAL